MRFQTLLRYLDLAGQIIMLFPLLGGIGDAPGSGLLTYFTLGSWQVLSFLIHRFAGGPGRAQRSAYGQVLSTLVICTMAGLSALGLQQFFSSSFSTAGQILEHLAQIILYPVTTALILGTPVMAIWYFIIGVAELRNEHAALRHRREIHWKL